MAISIIGIEIFGVVDSGRVDPFSRTVDIIIPDREISNPNERSGGSGFSILQNGNSSSIERYFGSENIGRRNFGTLNIDYRFSTIKTTDASIKRVIHFGTCGIILLSSNITTFSCCIIDENGIIKRGFTNIIDCPPSGDRLICRKS